jgi:hypothetical protein
MSIKHFLALAPFLFLAGCADFPEKYENVIEGEKIRPFAILVDPPEAAPGDTVRVQLKLYDAGKDYGIAWELALRYQLNVGATSSAFPNATEIVDLETVGEKIGVSPDGLSFSVVIPSGGKNPVALTGLSPEILRAESELSAEEKEGLRRLGIESFQGGLRKRDLVGALDSARSVPNSLAPLVDGLIGLVRFKAKITSPGFKLDITKVLTVRYSNRLEGGPFLSNVNRNPVIDSIGIIQVKAEGLTYFDEIAGHEADTVFFRTRSEVALDTPVYDTLTVLPDRSYFLFARSEGSEQPYRSPAGIEHKEQLFFQWFYSNLDKTGSDWKDLITLDNGDRPASYAVVPIRFPKAEAGLRHFSIKATVGDVRPEWGALASAGLDYKTIYGYLKYE